jgi:hypothetical protein
MNAMRKTETAWDVLMSSQIMSARIWLRAARLAAVAAGIGFVVTSGVARAQDDDNDETFEEKIIHNIMSGIGATNGEDRINYRERSPLVIPSNVNALPPPEAKHAPLAPNWPKDPDEIARKEAIEANRKPVQSVYEASRPLSPSELNIKPSRKKRRTADTGPDESRTYSNHLLSPSQLGFTNSMFSKVFGGTSTETKPFTGEPDRDSLTEPPKGYQTPSPNFAYGSGPLKPLHGEYNPAAGKYGDQ